MAGFSRGFSMEPAKLAGLLFSNRAWFDRLAEYIGGAE
jgi:hypothetical protein